MNVRNCKADRHNLWKFNVLSETLVIDPDNFYFVKKTNLYEIGQALYVITLTLVNGCSLSESRFLSMDTFQ